MINQMSQNENTERIKVLVQDDSVVKRNRSKPVELLARVYPGFSDLRDEVPINA